MKKIIALLLSLSLLLCTNALVYAAEGDDSSNEPIATVGDVSETVAESSTEVESGLTEESADTETSGSEEESDETETSVPSGESETPETANPTEESTVSENTVTTENSVTSQEPTGTLPDGEKQHTDEDIPAGDMPVATPMMADAKTFNVTIEWSGMCFTYHEKPLGEWNPNVNPPRYENSDTTPYWTSSDSAHPSYGTITVKLTEEIERTDLVTVDFKFNRTFGKYVAMYFSKDNSNVKEGSVLGEQLEFVNESSKEQSVYVIPGSGTLTSADFNGNDAEPISLGNITVTITVSGLYDPESPEQPGME